MIPSVSNWIGRFWRRARRDGTSAVPPPTLGPIDLSPSQREQVERRLAEFLEDSTSIYAYARRAAGGTQALPLFFDWTAFLALRLDGEVICVPYDDEPGDITVIQDEQMRNMALFQGTKLHPDLPFLIPTRPADAIDCPDCRGMGKLTFPPGFEHLSERVICRCGGLGWLLRNVKP